MVGQRFGRLIVESRAPRERWKARNAELLCLCDCGQRSTVTGCNLRSGKTRSCGCYARDVAGQNTLRHGMYDSPEYTAWEHIKQRCTNASCHNYRDYGGRGIKVCPEWLDSFDRFYADMGPRPAGCGIDRIDNDGDYCPGNCRWATQREQARNRRSNTYVVHNGVQLCIAEAAQMAGLSPKTIGTRMRRGWQGADLFLPVGSRPSKQPLAEAGE